MKRHTIWQIVRGSFIKFLENDPFNRSAAIAFSAIFSLPAILVISYAVSGMIYRPDLIQEELIQQLSAVMGQDVADFLLKAMTSSREFGANRTAIAVGVATLIFSTTGIFVSLQESLNAIWQVKPKPRNQWIKFMFNRLQSLLMVIGFGLLLLSMVLLDLILTKLNEFTSEINFPFDIYFFTFLNAALTFLATALVVASFFKVLPDARVKWRDVWIGSFLTTILLVAGKFLIGYFLTNWSAGSFYGAAGVFVVILMWVYYTSMILLWGAAFTYIYAQKRGHRIIPATYAVQVEYRELPKE